MQTQSSGWTNVNTGSTTLFGDYRTLIASTNFRARWITFNGRGSAGAVVRFATGPFNNPGFPLAGTTSGVVHIDELQWQGAGQGMNASSLSLEVDIPAGSEIGWQVRGNSGSNGNDMIVTISDTPLGVDVTGVDHGGPIAMLMPGDDVSDSPVTELIASLAINATWMVFGIETRDLTANNNNFLKVDVMTGAMGAEVPLIHDLGAIFFQSTNVRPQMRYVCMPVEIPAGTRISARAQFFDTGAGATHTQNCHASVTFMG